jgi:5-methylcytosine-specific restriction endonuclease McrA
MKPCLIGQATGKCKDECQRIAVFGTECTHDMISDYSDAYLEKKDENPKVKKKKKKPVSNIENPSGFGKRTRKIKLYELAKGICYLCEQKINFVDASVDHVIPISKGGSSTLSNLKIAHSSCNGWKGSRLLSELDLVAYRKKIQSYNSVQKVEIPIAPMFSPLYLKWVKETGQSGLTNTQHKFAEWLLTEEVMKHITQLGDLKSIFISVRNFAKQNNI